MGMYTKRVQTVLTEEQSQRLRELSEERRKPISVLVREAVEQTYFAELDIKRRLSTLERLLGHQTAVRERSDPESEFGHGAPGEW